MARLILYLEILSVLLMTGLKKPAQNQVNLMINKKLFEPKNLIIVLTSAALAMWIFKKYIK